MQYIAKLFLCLSVVAIGCGKAEPASRETPDQVAARIFDLAQNLEKEHKAKEAFAAYRQVVRNYPATPSGKKAADRIAEAQKTAILRKQR